jgi:hypothetical protein
MGLSNVIGLDSGDNFNAAVLADGTLWTWGLNDFGQLGDGSTVTRTSPGKVSGLIVVAQPTFSLAGGTFTTIQSVTVACTTSGAVIHYTTNGQEPLETDPVITSGQSLQISHSVTLKARAFKTGWVRSNVMTAAYTIVNLIDDTAFFVSQHYLDFLNREADVPGLQFWVNNIDSCGSDTACREVKRIDTSAAYFLSIEFQETGYLVHRFYRASFGRRPLYTEFLNDTQAIGNNVIVNFTRLAGTAGEQQAGVYKFVGVASGICRDAVLRLFAERSGRERLRLLAWPT